MIDSIRRRGLFDYLCNPLFWGGLVALAAVPAVLLLQGAQSDLRVYRAGGAALLHGVGLYSPEFFDLTPGQQLPFVYPPFAAVLFMPMSAVPWWLVTAVFTAMGIAGLAVAAGLTARRVYGPTNRAGWIALVVIGCWFLFQPARSTVSWGQINLILLGMVSADCLAVRTRWPRGALVGLAAAIKLTPAAFGLYFLLRRQYREAAVSAVSFAGFSLVGFVLAPSDSVGFWFSALFRDRVGIRYYMNQGIRGMLSRLGLATPVELMLWALLALALLGLAVFAARRAVAAGQPVTALLAIATWGVLASPISWAHHWVWVVVAAVALPRLLARSRTATRCVLLAALSVFAVGPVWLGGVEPAWLRDILVSPYAVVGLGLLVALAWRLPSRRDSSGPQGTSGSLVESRAAVTVAAAPAPVRSVRESGRGSCAPPSLPVARTS